MNIYVFCIFPVFITDDENIPMNMIPTAVLVLKFLINHLLSMQLGDMPNFIKTICSNRCAGTLVVNRISLLNWLTAV